MHRHWCEVTGHEYECNDDCVCIGDLPMEGHDHSGCPIELRPCPEHKPEQGRQTAEAVASGAVSEFVGKVEERQAAAPNCACGCADIDPSASVGFCLWCGHRYAEYSLEFQAKHFAFHCPGAPEKLKESEREWLARGAAKRGRKNGRKPDHPRSPK